jgi:hypothetical protein
MGAAGHHARSHELTWVTVLTRNSKRKILWQQKLVKVRKNEKPRKGKYSLRIDIPKNTHLKACRTDDEERRFLLRHTKYYIFEFYD